MPHSPSQSLRRQLNAPFPGGSFIPQYPPLKDSVPSIPWVDDIQLEVLQILDKVDEPQPEDCKYNPESDRARVLKVRVTGGSVDVVVAMKIVGLAIDAFFNISDNVLAVSHLAPTSTWTIGDR